MPNAKRYLTVCTWDNRRHQIAVPEITDQRKKYTVQKHLTLTIDAALITINKWQDEARGVVASGTSDLLMYLHIAEEG